MKIIKKRIRNVEQYTSLFAQNEEIYIVSSLKDIDSSVKPYEIAVPHRL